jgi:hypothetical protein
MRVEFIDTSILVEFLHIPGHNSNQRSVLAEFNRKRKSGVHFFLPTAAIIEAGNHIHYISDGRVRRQRAQKFAEVLRLTAQGDAPWTLYEAIWNGQFLVQLQAGATTDMDLVEHAATQCLSCGDLRVVAERDEYRRRVSKGTEVVIWSLDSAMNSWA